MVMDHIHYFFGFTGWIPEWFSMVGRLGAPLFLFCLVEGFTHTRNRKRYFAKVHSAAPSGSWCGGQRQLSAANGSPV